MGPLICEATVSRRVSSGYRRDIVDHQLADQRFGIAVEPEGGGLELVGARPGYRVQSATGEAGLAHVEGGDEHLKLLDRVERNDPSHPHGPPATLCCRQPEDVLVQRAINVEGVEAEVGARDRDPLLPRRERAARSAAKSTKLRDSVGSSSMISAVTSVEIPIRPGSNSMSRRTSTAMPSISTASGSSVTSRVTKRPSSSSMLFARVLPEADARDGKRCRGRRGAGCAGCSARRLWKGRCWSRRSRCAPG